MALILLSKKPLNSQILKEISIPFHYPVKLYSRSHYNLFKFILKILT